MKRLLAIFRRKKEVAACVGTESLDKAVRPAKAASIIGQIDGTGWRADSLEPMPRELYDQMMGIPPLGAEGQPRSDWR